MSGEVMRACLDFATEAAIAEFDLTGGAPELNPDFPWLIERLAERGATITDRCNLTVLHDRRVRGIEQTMARCGVDIVASLPCYLQENTDGQRGGGVFEASIEGLRKLNAVGYGLPDSDLELVLMHNPAGPFLPPSEAALEQDYRERLREDYGVEFTRLVALANVPCGRFAAALEDEGELGEYMALLESEFAAANLPGLMCRNLISVRWDGRLYDCDFNQCLDLPIRMAYGVPADIAATDAEDLEGRQVLCLDHCYGCTAGQGSSCGGALSE
jgi:radical SAM/Cys-rich protein